MAMRLPPACRVIWAAMLLLPGCASDPDAAGRPPPVTAPLTLNVGNGIGSQYGNYAAQIEGEAIGDQGERCVIYNWDRPLTRDLAIRLRSRSCESRERPGWMLGTELSRTVIPLSQSNLIEDPQSP